MKVETKAQRQDYQGNHEQCWAVALFLACLTLLRFQLRIHGQYRANLSLQNRQLMRIARCVSSTKKSQKAPERVWEAHLSVLWAVLRSAYQCNCGRIWKVVSLWRCSRKLNLFKANPDIYSRLKCQNNRKCDRGGVNT